MSIITIQRKLSKCLPLENCVIVTSYWMYTYEGHMHIFTPNIKFLTSNLWTGELSTDNINDASANNNSDTNDKDA